MDTYVLDAHVMNRRTKRRRALAAILLASSLATLGAGAMSLAVFTDTDATDGAWSTGTIDLNVGPTTTFGTSAMMPGDTGEQTITVNNDGTGDLRYALTSAETDASGLLGQMTLTINAGACPAAGAELYAGSFAGAVLGNTQPGDQGADRVVDAGESDELCFSWELPVGTGNSFQDKSATAVFTFAAEQTTNNP
jgi:hypothetical protein